MDNNILKHFNAALLDVEAICRREISNYLESLNYASKRDYDIVHFEPTIPDTEDDIEDAINAHIDIYAGESLENFEDLKHELIDYCKKIDLTIDPDLPLYKFKEEMRIALHKLSRYEMLKIGLFGHPVSIEEAAKQKEQLISLFLMSIERGALESLLHTIGKPDLIPLDTNHQQISNKFPKLVALIKEKYLQYHTLN